MRPSQTYLTMTGQPGFVYVLSSDREPELLKIGMTTKHPSIRVQELNSTGVAYPLVLRAAYEVHDARTAERVAHERYARYRLRPDREFFTLPLEEVLRDLPTALASQNLLVLSPELTGVKRRKPMKHKIGIFFIILAVGSFFAFLDTSYETGGDALFAIGTTLLFGALGARLLNWPAKIRERRQNKAYKPVKREPLRRKDDLSDGLVFPSSAASGEHEQPYRNLDGIN